MAEQPNVTVVGITVRSIIKKIWIRKGSVLGFGVVLGILVFAGLELREIVDFIPVGYQPETEIERIAPIIGAFGTVALTFGLLLLYSRQTKILEQQYQPYLSGDIDLLNPVASQFLIRNSGSDFAYQVMAEWTLGGEENSWETPSLGPGETAGFPIAVDDDGRWLLNHGGLREYLEKQDGDNVIDYTITCEDQFGIQRKFSGKVDVGVLTKREESREIYDADPLDSIDNSISNIEASIDAIASDVDDRRDEQEWKDRWDKNQAVINIVQEREQVPVDALARMINTRISQLEYRLSELEEAGFVVYDDGKGVVRAPPDPGMNTTLAEWT